MFRKITVLLISFCFVFEQASFAQMAAPLSMPLSPASPSVDKFRPVHLRSIGYDRRDDSFNLILDRGDLKKTDDSPVTEESGRLFEYFRTGLALPNSVFWVNLRPDGQNDIIDPALEKTDLGKVLLEADVQLKKDLATYTSPRTAEGREYWQKLYAKAETIYGSSEVTIPTLARPWIVPGEVFLSRAKDGASAYVYKATLQVMLEQDYLNNGTELNFSDQRQSELNAYSAQLIKELILPRLNLDVNSARRYAALRQAYYSLILAQWFKQQFAGSGAGYASLIDSREVSGLSTQAWSKDTYFNQYRDSFNNGEFRIQEQATLSDGKTGLRTYCSGGFMLGNVLAGQGKQFFDGGAPVIDPNDIVIHTRAGGIPDGGIITVNKFLTTLKKTPKESDPEFTALKDWYRSLLGQWKSRYKDFYLIDDYVRNLPAGQKNAVRGSLLEVKRAAIFDLVKSDPSYNGLGEFKAYMDSKGIDPAVQTDTLRRVNEWLTREGYSAPQFRHLLDKLQDMIAQKQWEQLLDCFYVVVDFGTAGKRATQSDKETAEVQPGTNRINDYIVAEYTLGLAQYLRSIGQQKRGVTAGGDTRIKSSEPREGWKEGNDAEIPYTVLQSAILRAMGINVFRYAQARSIAQVAWTTVRQDAASMEYNSASHNFWFDNGVKASNEFSAQLFKAERDAIAAYIDDVLPEDFLTLGKDVATPGTETVLGRDKDQEYIDTIRSYAIDRDLIGKYSGDVHSVYTALKGSGIYTVPEILNDGKLFRFDVHALESQKYQDSQHRFKGIRKPDPGEMDSLDGAIAEAVRLEKEQGKVMDFVFGTDPDSDRSAYAIWVKNGDKKTWKMVSANDAWSLFTWYQLDRIKQLGKKMPKYVVKTWVTTDLIKDIAQSKEFNLKVLEPKVGFNNIAEVALKEIVLPRIALEEAKKRARVTGQTQEALYKELANRLNQDPISLNGLAAVLKGKQPEKVTPAERKRLIKKINAYLKEMMLFGAEESNGYSPGGHTLEKDAAAAVLMFQEVAAYMKYLNGQIRVGNFEALPGRLNELVKNDPARQLTMNDLFNNMYLQYGYYATENMKIDAFSKGIQGKQEMKDLLDKVKNTVVSGNSLSINGQAATPSLADAFIKSTIEAARKGTMRENLADFPVKLMSETGYRFDLAPGTWVILRPSGTEPYIRDYAQIKVDTGTWDWGNIEQKKAEADQRVKDLAKNAATALGAPMKKPDGGNDDQKKGQEPQQAKRAPGGIDFRGLPLIEQPLGDYLRNFFDQPAAARISDLDSEWKHIEGLVRMQVVPKAQEIRDFLAACYNQGELEQRMDDLSLCVGRIMRLEEDKAAKSEPEMRKIMVLLEAAR